MRALDKKLWRDFARLWAQALAIALVLASGVTVVVLAFGTQRAMEDTRAAFYERNRFAEVFATARRAPESLLPEILAIPGVRAAELRITGMSVLDIEGLRETAMGQIVALPRFGDPALNVPLVRSGRLPDPLAPGEVAVNEAFAIANRFQAGDSFLANMNGQKRLLTITGTLLSPEFIYTIGPGAMMPDNQRFAIMWVSHKTAAAAFDLEGAFNDVTLKLTRDANLEVVKDMLEDLLDDYGGTGAYDRSTQISHSFLDAELKQLQSMSTVLPPVFFVISAFLVNMVLARLIALEREQIGLFKAIGYSNARIAGHYLKLTLMIAALGILLGWGFGTWLARGMAELYGQFFAFPYVIFRTDIDTYALSATLAGTAAAVGAMRSVWQAVRLTPAVAMSPPAPTRFKRNPVDRLGTMLRVTQPTMMILRTISRWPLRALVTICGVAAAVAMLISSTFFTDSLDGIIDAAFFQSNRQHAILMLASDLPHDVLAEAENLPGAMQVEGQQYLAATLRNGHLSKRTPIEGRPSGADLSRIFDFETGEIATPGDGIVLSDRLAEQLDLGIGDLVEVETMGGRRETYFVPVSGIIRQFFGLGAYMDIDALNRLLRQAPQVSVVNLTLDPTRIDDFYDALKDTPKLAGTVMLTDVRRSFEDTISENIIIMTTVYTIIAILITVGVTYNTARIQLSERAREMASLRILGFTRGEVSYILMGELMLLVLIAQPLGWWFGYALAAAMTEGFSSDLYSIPLILKPKTLGYASLIVLGAGLASVLVVRRRLDRLNLVAVMKTRE